MLNEQIDYPMVEHALTSIISQNQKPTILLIKKQLNISDSKFDQIIEYYFYMWEQRHTATYLETLEPLKAEELSRLQTIDFAKRTVLLEESLAMMRATIEATEDCLLMINKEGKLIGFNKKLVDFVGLPQSVLKSKDETEGLKYLFSQIADPQELALLVKQKYQNPVAGPCGEMFFKDGRVVERFYQPQIVNNEVVGHVWSLRDISERRKQEETLRLANRAMSASTHGIILIENNTEFTITYLNPASTGLLNIDESKSLQKPLLTAIPELASQQNKLMEILQTEKKGSLTFQYPTKEKVIWLDIKIDPVYNKDQTSISHFVGIINDISRNKELESILQYKAVHDALTGLPNKLYIDDSIRYRINKAARTGEKFGLLFLDIDRFKNINDTLGHRVGDILLSLFSKRMQNNLQKQDVIARIGGDEFIILINTARNEAELHAIAKRLLEACRKKFSHGYHEFNITASIGIVMYPDGGQDSETLISNADIAMYQAKFSGRNRSCFYTKSLNHTISRRVEIENELHNASKNNEFSLHYQPIYNIQTKRFDKIEALLRWHNKKLGHVSPAEFIPVAEDIGMMQSIGHWVVEAAIAQQHAWRNSEFNNMIISINVSAKQLLDEHFVQQVKNDIQKNNTPPEKIIIEVTESFFLLQEKVPEKLNELNKLGVKIAIDDFGTGYSNLSYLNKLHISYLKIDKSFVDQIDQDQFNDSVLLTIMAIGKRMKFRIIAEGVETKNQYQFLADHDCDEIQGYYFSKPLPIQELEKFLKKNK